MFCYFLHFRHSILEVLKYEGLQIPKPKNSQYFWMRLRNAMPLNMLLNMEPAKLDNFNLENLPYKYLNKIKSWYLIAEYTEFKSNQLWKL